MLHQQAGRDRGRHRLVQRVECGHAFAQLDPQGLDVLQAEVPAEDGGLGQGLLRLVGNVTGPTRDERANRRRNQAVGVLRERPRPVDLLDHPRVAIRVGEFLDDERNAFGLRVHGGRARRVDLPGEDLAE